MRFIIVAFTVALTFAFPTRPAVAADSEADAWNEFLGDASEMEVRVPEIIQKDLCQKACKFLEDDYPDID